MLAAFALTLPVVTLGQTDDRLTLGVDAKMIQDDAVLIHNAAATATPATEQSQPTPYIGGHNESDASLLMEHARLLDDNADVLIKKGARLQPKEDARMLMEDAALLLKDAAMIKDSTLVSRLQADAKTLQDKATKLQNEQPPEPTCAHLDNFDYDGGDLHHVSVSDQNDCCDKCNDYDGCAVAVHYLGVCYLKSSSATPKGASGRTAYLLGVESKCGAGHADTDYDCANQSGCELGYVTNTDMDTCCALCTGRDDCAHAVYYPGYKNSCYMKGKNAKPITMSGRTALTPGEANSTRWY